MSPPKLSKAGRRLWRWLIQNYDITGAEPLAGELCTLADRLEQVRAALNVDDLKPADRGRLIGAEVKLCGQYGRVWRLLGLADPEKTPKRPVGRPPGS